MKRKFGFDSRQSWEVLAACCVIKFMSFGLTEVSGILMVSTMIRYDTTREAASFPYTLIYSIRNGTGPLIAYIGQIIGIRSATLIGCVISSIAVGSCFFAENILEVTIAWGVIFGIGFALESLLLNAILIEHFKNKLSLAIGITTNGAIFGTICFAPFIDYVTDYCGLSGAFLLISAVILHALPAAIFILLNRPDTSQQSIINHTNTEMQCVCGDKSSAILNTGNRKMSVEFVDYFRKKSSSLSSARTGHTNDDSKSIKSIYSSSFIKKEMPVSEAYTQYNNDAYIFNEPNQWTEIPLNSATLSSNIPNDNENAPIVVCQRCDSLGSKLRKFSTQIEALPSKIANKLNSNQVMIRLFKDPIYWLILLAGGLHCFTLPAWFILLVDYAIDIGLDPMYSKYIVMYNMIMECFGCLLLGWVADLGYVSSNGFAALCFLGESLAMVVIIWANNIALLALVIVLFQWSQTGLTLIYPAVAKDSMEKTLQSSAIASMFLLAAPLDLLISPLVGFFRDKHGSYTGVYLTLASAAILGGIVQICVLKLVNRRNQHNIA